jgi:heme-degrading monooxygenase HmoA
MIARVWRAITSLNNADRYLEYLDRVVLPGYRAVDGNQGVFIFRNVREGLVYFLLLSIWSSQEALAGCSGLNLEVPRQAAEEQKFLIASESVVAHYEVVASIHPCSDLTLGPEP